jgi:hypothetical protein
MADAKEEDVEKIRDLAAQWKVWLPPQVEKHGIFPLKFEKHVEGEPYKFEYVELAAAWGVRDYKDTPEHSNWGGFCLRWGAKGVGFGELTFRLKGGKMDEDSGEIEGAECVCDSEYMGRDFVKDALAHFANTVKIV